MIVTFLEFSSFLKIFSYNLMRLQGYEKRNNEIILFHHLDEFCLLDKNIRVKNVKIISNTNRNIRYFKIDLNINK